MHLRRTQIVRETQISPSFNMSEEVVEEELVVGDADELVVEDVGEEVEVCDRITPSR